VRLKNDFCYTEEFRNSLQQTPHKGFGTQASDENSARSVSSMTIRSGESHRISSNWRQHFVIPRVNEFLHGDFTKRVQTKSDSLTYTFSPRQLLHELDSAEAWVKAKTDSSFMDAALYTARPAPTIPSHFFLILSGALFSN